MSTAAAQRPVSVGDYNTPVQRLDQALVHLRSLSSTQSAAVSCSSLGSPPPVFTPTSKVFPDSFSANHSMRTEYPTNHSTMRTEYITNRGSDPLIVKSNGGRRPMDNYGYTDTPSEEGSSLSPLSSSSSKQWERIQRQQSKGERQVDINSNTVERSSNSSCTCCPYGYHQYVVTERSLSVYLPVEFADRFIHRPEVNGEGYVTVKQVSNIYSTLPPQQSNGENRRLDSGGSNSLDRNRQTRQLSPSHTLSSSRHHSNNSDTDMSASARSRNIITKTTRTITSSSDILPETGENESLTISPEAIRQIKSHTESSNRLIKELQDQLRLIPQMQERIRSLKEDKRLLGLQLQDRSGVSSMRSIGVGDYDVDEEHKIVERVRQTVMKEAPAVPVRSVGVGVYDVSQELYTQADMSHTIAEHVKKIREKEIQTWIQEAEAEYSARKASTRSFGVGEKDIWDEENRLIKEREMRTIVIGQQEKPSQRNVGLQVKPAMRDVCIEFSQKDTKPLTRSCGFNVDIGDIIQEMSSQMEITQSPQQQQQNSWTVQKHVIQRKFIEAMRTGRQEDLVAFITGLLKRQVRSVGTTVKPTTSDFSMSTSASVCERGVGEDSVDVTVRPIVQTKDTFTLAKPITRTQPTWTDLILTCDAGTNTQRFSNNAVDRGCNTSPPQEYSNQRTETTITTRHHKPNMSHFLGESNTHNQVDYTRAPAVSQQSMTDRTGAIHETVTETVITERSRSKPEIERKYHSHVDKLVAPPPTQIDLDITLPREVTTEERTTTTRDMTAQRRRAMSEEHHRSEMHMILPGNPDSLKQLTVQVLPQVHTAGGEVQSSTHTLLAKGSKIATELPATNISPRQSQLVSSSQTATDSYLTSSTSDRSRSRSMPPSSHSAIASSTEELSSRVIRTRPDSPSQIRSTALSPSMSSTKRVISEQGPYSTMKETSEVTESGDTLRKETVIERTFSSSNSKSTKPVTSSDNFSSSLSDFDYFGKTYSGSKPQGHAERMERYGGATLYSSTGANVDAERNKTELHGNPLKSRYTIEEMSGTTVVTPTSPSYSSTVTEARSSLKRNESPRVSRKSASVKFADHQLSNRFSAEFVSSCQVIQEFVQQGGSQREHNSRVASATSLVQSKWFELAGQRNSDIDTVQTTLSYLEQNYSRAVLEYIINLTDGNGNTSLHYAVSHGNYDITRALLDTGVVKINTQNKAGYTPVMLAAICEVKTAEEKSSLQYLLSKADVNIRATQAGQTALMLAVSHACMNVMRLILDQSDCDVNLQDFDGSTALMCAAEHNNTEIVETLLAHPSIDVLIKDQDGSNALDIALENGREEIAELLQRKENSSAKSRQSSRLGVGRKAVIPPRSAGAQSNSNSSSSSSSRSYTSRYI